MTALGYKLIECEDEREWHEKRRALMTASDMAAALGVHPNKAALQLHHEKRGTLPSSIEETKRMRLGHRLEPVMHILYEQRFGVTLHNPGSYTIAVSDEHPYLAATLDRVVEPDRRKPVEFKSISEFQRSGYKDGILPEHHHIQAQTQNIVAGADSGDVFATVGDWEMLLWLLDYLEGRERVAAPLQYALTVTRHEELQLIITRTAEQFMDGVKRGVEPDADASASCAQTIKTLYAADNGLARTATVHEAALIETYLSRKAIHAEAERLLKESKNQLALAMGDYSFIETPHAVISNKLQQRAGFTVQPTSFRVLRDRIKKED